MANITIRAKSGTGSSWSNIPNTYDTDVATGGTVGVSALNYSGRSLTQTFDMSSIPSNATIVNAMLTVSSKASSNNRVTLRVDLNGDSQKRVINASIGTETLDFIAQIPEHINTIQTIKFIGYSTSLASTTVTLYDVNLSIEYTVDQTDGFEMNSYSVYLGEQEIGQIYLGENEINF